MYINPLKMAEVRIEIPGVPPTNNHYKTFRVMPGKNGRGVPRWYLTAQAKDWFATVAAHAAGRKLRAESYHVSYAVFTASAVCTDVDNYAKCVLDGLAHCGLIDNDKKVIDLHGYRRIDRSNPRTVIIVRTRQDGLFGGAA